MLGETKVWGVLDLVSPLGWRPPALALPGAASHFGTTRSLIVRGRDGDRVAVQLLA